MKEIIREIIINNPLPTYSSHYDSYIIGFVLLCLFCVITLVLFIYLIFTLILKSNEIKPIINGEEEKEK